MVVALVVAVNKQQCIGPGLKPGNLLAFLWREVPGVSKVSGNNQEVRAREPLARLPVPQLLNVKTPVEVAGDKYRHVAPLWSAAP